MSNFVIILGKTGNGKSTSIKTLDPKETVVLQVKNKALPYAGSGKNYSKENKNKFLCPDWSTLQSMLDNIDKNAKHVKTIVIDDATYIMRNEFFDRSKERGYDRFTEIADHFRRIIDKCSTLRDDLNVFMILHCEYEESDGSYVGYKVATIGKLLDKQYNPLECVSVTLFAEPKFDDKGNPQFGFYTKKRIVKGIELPCKTPEGMFEEDFIPNDLQYVVDKMNEYYNG